MQPQRLAWLGPRVIGATLRRPATLWAALALAGLTALVGLGWIGLTYQPEFYAQRRPAASPQTHERAQQFVSRTLQLRNDIVNEPNWSARFSDEQVNAWLAEDLVESFADQIPAGFTDPRVLFAADRVTLACQYQDGPLPSVVWAIVRVDVPRDNEVTLTIEKVQAGAFPLPTARLLENLSRHARERGLDVSWAEERGTHVVTIRYTTHPERGDVVLERVQVAPGWLVLSGRSDQPNARSVDARLPSGRVIQSKLRNQQRQGIAPDSPPVRTSRNSSTPRST